MQVPEQDYMSFQLIDYFESIGFEEHIYNRRFENIFGSKSYSLEYVINHTRLQCYQAIQTGRDHFKLINLLLGPSSMQLFWEEVAPFFLRKCHVEFCRDEDHLYRVAFRDARSDSSNMRDGEKTLLLTPTERPLDMKQRGLSRHAE